MEEQQESNTTTGYVLLGIGALMLIGGAVWTFSVFRRNPAEATMAAGGPAGQPFPPSGPQQQFTPQPYGPPPGQPMQPQQQFAPQQSYAAPPEQQYAAPPQQPYGPPPGYPQQPQQGQWGPPPGQPQQWQQPPQR